MLANQLELTQAITTRHAKSCPISQEVALH